MSIEDFERCVEKADSEEEIHDCKEDYDIGDKSIEVKDEANEIIEENAIKNMKPESIAGIITESYRKDKEISVSICADGSLRGKSVGHKRGVKPTRKGCRWTAGFFHTHPAGDLENIIEPSAKDIFSSYRFSTVECIGRKTNVAEPNEVGEPVEEEDMRYVMKCFEANEDSEIGKKLEEVVWDNINNPVRFLDIYKNADVIEKNKAIEPVVNKYWKPEELHPEFDWGD